MLGNGFAGRTGSKNQKENAIGFLFLFFAAGGTANAGEVEIFRTKHVPVNGVVIVAHGLNVKPAKMGGPEDEGTIVKALLDGGYHVVRAALTGHSGEEDGMTTVTARTWLDDARECVSVARSVSERADAQPYPLYLVGFSLGALVFEVLMNEGVVFEKAVLFSPAVAIKTLVRGVLLLGFPPFTLPGGGQIIASKSPVEYRAGAGVSLAAYKALFELEKRLAADSFAKNNIPTLVFIDPLDELVSYTKLKRLISKFNLSNWRQRSVYSKGGRVRPAYRHLIIDGVCLSEKEWAAVRRDMLDFLSG
ncbi:MAG: alpha/beta fold hydrolase [Spirochaetaceae bacterium]|jgi:esterase/lipase|nr:alpha/beta fold hydrolase [Spirochaetaceae bacterium]